VYTVRVSNAAGCFAEASTEVFVATPASIGIPNDTSVCPGTSVTLNIIGGVTYDWEPKVDITGANTANPTITPSQPRTYTVNILDNNGCDINGIVNIGIHTPADPQAGTDATICIGESALLTATNGVSYSWQPAALVNDNTLDSAIATPGITTVFTVTIIDANGCENQDEVTITVQPLPNVDAGPDLYIYEGARAVLKATGASTYVWSPGLWMNDTTIAEPIIFPDDTITYYVVGTDLFGCSNVDTVNVFVLPSPKFYVPTAISPNGDGRNDEFLISYYENFNLISLRIFNRWGVMVFETDDIANPWDGRSADGQPLPIGTYVYIIEGVDDIGVPQHRQGNITIVR
jgi:gliding motility-associated-like protein